MASGRVITHPHELRSLIMKNDNLAVQGTGITPRATSPADEITNNNQCDQLSPASQPSSRVSITSDDDVTHSVDDEEANSMLQGVITMNEVLEGQIEALRLRLHVEDKQHREAKNKLLKEKDSVINAKEGEIEDLKDSLVNRDERIHTLVRASEEKDKTIQSKVLEIDELKKMVKQTEDYAHKLHKQIGRVKHEKQTLETDTLYKEQNSEISRLTEELADLKRRLGEMEQELQRATKIIEQQNVRIRELEEERGSMHAKFREELDKATKAMRQEVERMREVMRQNYEEMRQLRDQNRQMHSDVKDIKDLLMKSRGQPTPRYEGTGIQRPLTASPVHMFRPVEYSSRSPVPPKGSSNPRTPSQGVGMGRQSRPGGGVSSNVRTSVGDSTSRVLNRTQQAPQKTPARQDAQPRAGNKSVQPAVCSLKDDTGLPAIGRLTTQQQQHRTKSAFRVSTGKSQRK